MDENTKIHHLTADEAAKAHQFAMGIRITRLKGGPESQAYTYAGGDDPSEVAWHLESSDRKTHPAGLKKPNELGLYDMSGNVWERCWDRAWMRGYDARDHTVDPTGPPGGYGRRLHGGSWNRGEEYLHPYKTDNGKEKKRWSKTRTSASAWFASRNKG